MVFQEFIFLYNVYGTIRTVSFFYVLCTPSMCMCMGMGMRGKFRDYSASQRIEYRVSLVGSEQNVPI